jgi:glycosyltransferase involved in cell wall biosynthesis
MKKIGIDARLINKRRGIGNICYNFLKEINKIVPDFKFIAYIDSEKIPEELQDSNIISFSSLKPSFYPFWEQFLLPLIAQRDGVALLHSVANTFPLLLPQTIKQVVSINDVMFLLPKDQMPSSPSLYQTLGRYYSKLIVKSGYSSIDKIITISEFSKTDILHQLNINSSKVVPVLLGADLPQQTFIEQKISIFESRELNSPYILALGARDPRKNTTLIIKAFSALKKQFTSPISLVISGLDQSGIEQFSNLVRELGLEGCIHLLGFIDRSDLDALYSQASCFLYPSLYEGFGLPLLEAMAHGTPVISSNTTAIPEVAGDAALLVNPTSKDEIVAALLRILTDNVFKETLKQRGLERVKLFSWRQMAEQILQTYEEVLAQ